MSSDRTNPLSPTALYSSPETIHNTALIIDTHVDTPQRFVDDNFDLSDPLNGGQINLDAIHKGNLDASFMSIWVEPDLFKGHYARRTLELIDASREQAAKHPDQIKRTLRHILLSDAAFNNWGQKTRRPFEAVAAALRTSGSNWTPRIGDAKSDEFSWRMGFTGHMPYDWPAPNGYPDTTAAWSGSNSLGMTWKLLNWLTETMDAETPLLPILAASRSSVAQWTSTNLVDCWCRRLLGYLPARRQVLVDFMRQNGAATDVIADTDAWSANDLKKHYNQQRLRSMVSLVLMSPEFLAR